MAHSKLDPAETAVQQVKALGYSPSDVRHVLLTHLDRDHAGPEADGEYVSERQAAHREPSMGRRPRRSRRLRQLRHVGRDCCPGGLE